MIFLHDYSFRSFNNFYAGMKFVVTVWSAKIRIRIHELWVFLVKFCTLKYCLQFVSDFYHCSIEMSDEFFVLKYADKATSIFYSEWIPLTPMRRRHFRWIPSNKTLNTFSLNTVKSDQLSSHFIKNKYGSCFACSRWQIIFLCIQRNTKHLVGGLLSIFVGIDYIRKQDVWSCETAPGHQGSSFS